MADRKAKVQVWIRRRSPSGGAWQVLLLLTRPDRGGFWQPVTGAVEAGESLTQAALREATEETGIQFIEQPRMLGIEFAFRDRWGNDAQETAFELEAPPDSNIKTDPSEHVESIWLTLEEAAPRLGYPTYAKALELLSKKKNK